MARVRARRAHARLDDLTFGMRFYLNTGHQLGALPAFDRPADARAAWALHRDELTRRKATSRPGHRPWAFWAFDHPRALAPDDAPQQYDRRRLLPDAADDWQHYLDAIRRSVAYLARHGLLFPSEMAALRDPHRRADGDLRDWDRAALAGLADADQETKQ